MEQNERKNMIPVFVEPEMIEDLPLTRSERFKEYAKNIRRKAQRIRLPKAGTVLIFMAAAAVLLALIAVPVLPLIAVAMLLVSSFRSAFRAQTA